MKKFKKERDYKFSEEEPKQKVVVKKKKKLTPNKKEKYDFRRYSEDEEE